MAEDLVLVTGASGFIARHVVLALLQAGWRVRGTVRSAANGEAVRRLMAGEGADVSRFSMTLADLNRDANWAEAARGCRFVLHVASPFPRGLPRDKFALVPVARDGTRRVLRAAISAGVERVVVTSSVAAVWYGHDERAGERFTEADVSNVESASISAYAVSKTLAEQAAWETAAGSGTALSVVNPAMVFGPLIGTDIGTSASLVRMMMRGQLPLVPDLWLGIVDVRDVAVAHLAAMTIPAAAGRRFILSAGSLAIREVAAVIGRSQPRFRHRLPRGTIPDAIVKALALVSPSARHALPELGRRREAVSEAAKTILGVSFRSPESAVETMAKSLVDQRLV